MWDLSEVVGVTLSASSASLWNVSNEAIRTGAWDGLWKLALVCMASTLSGMLRSHIVRPHWHCCFSLACVFRSSLVTYFFSLEMPPNIFLVFLISS
jgi:hypothetical protein